MKRIIIIAALALMSVSAFAQESVDTTLVTGSTPKFACVSYQEIVLLAPQMDTVRAILNENSRVQHQILMEMVQEYQGKAQLYEQNATTWTQSVVDMKRKELADFESRIGQFQQTAQAEISLMQDQKTAEVAAQVNEVISKLAAELGVAAVLKKEELLYWDPNQFIDLTSDARAVLGIPEGRTLETLEAELEAEARAMQGSMGGM